MAKPLRVLNVRPAAGSFVPERALLYCPAATALSLQASQPPRIVNVPTTALASRREDPNRKSVELDRLTVPAANDATLVALPTSARSSRRRVLSHEEEVALARRIEAGESHAFFALLGTRTATAPIRAIAAELRAGHVLPTGLLRNAEEDADDEAHAERLARLLGRAAAATALTLRPARDAATRERRRRRRQRLAAELADARFERHVFARIAREIRAAGADERTRRAFSNGMGEASRALHEFVGANFGLVVTYARRFVGQGLDMHDLVQEGQLGLIRAVEKFDWRRGLRFSTYAAWWVRQAMARAIADQSRTIRVPVHLLESRHKLERVRRTMAQQGRRDPTDEELARESGLPLDKVRAIVGLVREPLRLEAPLGDEGDGGRLADLVADPRSPAPDEHMALERMQEQTRALLGLLTPREQQLLRLRFGMDGGPGHTLEEVGKSFNLSRERVRQIEAAALKKLRAASEERELGSYIGR